MNVCESQGRSCSWVMRLPNWQSDPSCCWCLKQISNLPPNSFSLENASYRKLMFWSKRSCNKSITTCLFSYQLSWIAAGGPRLWATSAPAGWLRTEVTYNNFKQLRGECAVWTVSIKYVTSMHYWYIRDIRIIFSYSMTSDSAKIQGSLLGSQLNGLK